MALFSIIQLPICFIMRMRFALVNVFAALFCFIQNSLVSSLKTSHRRTKPIVCMHLHPAAVHTRFLIDAMPKTHASIAVCKMYITSICHWNAFISQAGNHSYVHFDFAFKADQLLSIVFEIATVSPILKFSWIVQYTGCKIQ